MKILEAALAAKFIQVKVTAGSGSDYYSKINVKNLPV
jgi:hypothetical protein